MRTRTGEPRGSAVNSGNPSSASRKEVWLGIRILRCGNPGKRWLAFLHNHREVIVAFDFLTVPTVSFQLLYCFFVIEHGRRKILHFNVTRRPAAERDFQIHTGSQC
jgi:hypothetical protein